MRRVALVVLILLVIAAVLAVFVGVTGPASDDVEPPTAVVTEAGSGEPADEPHRVRLSPDLPVPEADVRRHEVVVELISPTGEPVTGVRLELRRRSESTQPPVIEPVDAAVTGADGRGRLGSGAGGYDVSVRDATWATWAHAVDLPTDDVLRIGVARGVRIRLRVEDPDGNPIPGARAREMYWDTAPPAIGGDDGVIDMGPVAAIGLTRFRVFARGYGTTLVDIYDAWDRGPAFEWRVKLHPGGPLRVRVRDLDGSAVPGADVWVRALRGVAWTVTGPDGDVVVDGVLMPPAVTVSVTAPDERHASVKLDVDGATRGERSVDLVLGPGRVVAGVVVRAADGAPVADAGIYTFGDPTYRLLTRTDPEGLFRVEHRPGAADAGAELLVVAPSLSMPEELVGAVEPGEGGSTQLRIELVDAVRLAGRVIGPDGRPVPEARVCVQHVEARRVLSEAPLTTTADQGGRFEISGVPAFDGLHVLADPPGRGLGLGTGWCEHLDDLTPGAHVDVGDIELPRTFTLSARVTDHDGAPVPNAWLVARYRVPTRGGFIPRRVQDGAFQPVPDLPLGRAYVEVDGPGFFETPIRVDETTEFLVLDRKCHVSGHVEASPLAGKKLQLRSTERLYTMDGNHARATIGADGRFECGPVRPGAYEVRIEESPLRGKVFVHEDGENLGSVELK